MTHLTILLILSICIVSVYGLDSLKTNNNNEENSTQLVSGLEAESRRRKVGHYFIHPFHGWYALSWIYWIKVKLIVVAFFVGTAFIWAIQYLGKFYHSCPNVEHLHYGHYRAMEDDPIVNKFLQRL